MLIYRKYNQNDSDLIETNFAKQNANNDFKFIDGVPDFLVQEVEANNKKIENERVEYDKVKYFEINKFKKKLLFLFDFVLCVGWWIDLK